MAQALNITSFNMHGFNQGAQFLIDLCLNNDIILIQEHWLSSNDFDKISVSKDFVVFAASSMEDDLSRGILRGRPYGGTGILVRKNLATSTKLLGYGKRFIALQIGSFIVCCVYLPCSSVSFRSDEFCDTLADIANTIEDCSYTSLIVGGDFNLNFIDNNILTFHLQNFCMKFSLQFTDNLLAPNELFTFRSLSAKSIATSLIDHFLISSNVPLDSVELTVADSGTNFSDHCALRMSIKDNGLWVVCKNDVHVCGDTGSDPEYIKSIKGRCNYSLRWDKGNLNTYYDLTYEKLRGIKLPASFRDNAAETGHCDIDALYGKLVDALISSSIATIPSVKINSLKHWWDAELDEAKMASIAAHHEWVLVGKPRNPRCPIFLKMNSCRLHYKSLLRSKERVGNSLFSNALDDALLNKEPNLFWKSWRSKFKKVNNAQVIAGSCSPIVIASKFSEVFRSVYGDNVDSDEAVFISRFSSYMTDTAPQTLTVEAVDWQLRHLKLGKAAGCDGVQLEHILYGHPIVIVLITNIFNACLKFGYVPYMFSQGIIVPLLKGSITDKTVIDNYRGITISSILSKLFEKCLLPLLGNTLGTSELQFGFKPNVGCRDAIFTARSISDFFTDRGSTVNLCALDLSKAFDKVNHFKLFSKLLDRKGPRCIVEVLVNWYSKCNARVRWCDALSDQFAVGSGVRQGGVLSPILFAVYIDDLFNKLRSSGLGCHINGIFLGCIAYADDILLISNSYSDLQRMLDICALEASSIDMSFNVKKSFVLRCGARFKSNCADLCLGSEIIAKVDSIKYLGIVFMSGYVLKCNLESAKVAFYRAFNALYSKCSSSASELSSVFLMKSYCLPILTFSFEALILSRSTIKMLQSVVDNAVRKIFNVNCSGSIREIRLNVGLSDMESLYFNSLCKFLLKFNGKALSFASLLIGLQYNHLRVVHSTLGLRFSGLPAAACRDIMSAVKCNV